ncbi:alpha/beta fold hydrolase [Brachybacterium tyrofermentans]|uniref:alpha/beta fold hydrolase n=1 Tax=Brachybacterium tyrofermentans TaxID=47848 RepID=UPI003FD2DB61
MQLRDVVLVHGLFHQTAHMDPLAEALRQRGARVTVPRLHRGSFEADVRAVQAVVDLCETPPILAGHSYGGAVIADVAGGGRYVFFAAFAPMAGESCAELGGPDALVNKWVRPHSSGGTYVPAQFARELFYADCSPAAASRAIDLLVPQAGGHGRGVVRRAKWTRAPSHYIVCDDDRAVSPELQQAMARRCDSNRHIRASHSPYISQPELVAEAIIG